MKTKQDVSYQKALKKALQKMERAASQAGARALQSRQNKFVSFDDAEVIPYSAGSTGQITITSSDHEDSTRSLESILAQEASDLEDTAMKELTEQMKEVFK